MDTQQAIRNLERVKREREVLNDSYRELEAELETFEAPADPEEGYRQLVALMRRFGSYVQMEQEPEPDADRPSRRRLSTTGGGVREVEAGRSSVRGRLKAFPARHTQHHLSRRPATSEGHHVLTLSSPLGSISSSGPKPKEAG
jgi:hypothetical protein